MSARQEVKTRLFVNGRPYLINLVHNPLIDDVVITEARIFASELENGEFNSERRVDRDIRDFLIRLKVEK